MSQYGVPSNVWKQWLSMSNMCRPVDPRRSIAEVLKTSPCKGKNTSSIMTPTYKSKVTTLSEPRVLQVHNKVISSRRGKSLCVHKSVYTGHTVDSVPCYNRFDPLQQIDTQQLDDQNESSIVGHTGHKVKSSVKCTKYGLAQKQSVHQQELNSQTSNDTHRGQDPVSCHAGFESSTAEIESKDYIPEIHSSNYFGDELYHQDQVQQLYQESEVDTLKNSHTINESLLKPLPECTAQLGSEFGVMHLTPLQIYRGPPTYNSVLNDPLLLHKRVRESCLPNYMGIRVPVATNLNIANWRHFLVDYWNDQLVDLLEFRFPLDFDRSVKLTSVEDNHKSAKDYEEHVKHYLQEELDHGAILAPFKNKPINLHVSPFMTRDKPDSQWRRTIVDLS